MGIAPHRTSSKRLRFALNVQQQTALVVVADMALPLGKLTILLGAGLYCLLFLRFRNHRYLASSIYS